MPDGELRVRQVIREAAGEVVDRVDPHQEDDVRLGGERLGDRRRIGDGEGRGLRVPPQGVPGRVEHLVQERHGGVDGGRQVCSRQDHGVAAVCLQVGDEGLEDPLLHLSVDLDRAGGVLHPDRIEQGRREGGNPGRRQREAVVRVRAGQRHGGLGDVQAGQVLGLRVAVDPAAGREVARRAEGLPLGAEEVGADREDDPGLREIRDRDAVLAVEPTGRRARGAIVHALPDQVLRPLRDPAEALDEGALGRPQVRPGQHERGGGALQGGDDRLVRGLPGRLGAVDLRVPQALRVVEREEGRLHPGVGAAPVQGVARQALDLDGASVDRLHHDPVRPPTVRPGGRVLERDARLLILRLLRDAHDLPLGLPGASGAHGEHGGRGEEFQGRPARQPVSRRRGKHLLAYGDPRTGEGIRILGVHG